jgi:hypothetical protein
MYCPFDRGTRCKNCPVEGYEISSDLECLKKCIKFNSFFIDEKTSPRNAKNDSELSK